MRKFAYRQLPLWCYLTVNSASQAHFATISRSFVLLYRLFREKAPFWKVENSAKFTESLIEHFQPKIKHILLQSELFVSYLASEFPIGFWAFHL